MLRFSSTILFATTFLSACGAVDAADTRSHVAEQVDVEFNLALGGLGLTEGGLGGSLDCAGVLLPPGEKKRVPVSQADCELVLTYGSDVLLTTKAAGESTVAASESRSYRLVYGGNFNLGRGKVDIKVDAYEQLKTIACPVLALNGEGCAVKVGPNVSLVITTHDAPKIMATQRVIADDKLEVSFTKDANLGSCLWEGRMTGTTLTRIVDTGSLQVGETVTVSAKLICEVQGVPDGRVHEYIAHFTGVE